MKKFLRFTIVSILIVTSAFAVFKISNKYRVSILKDDIDCTIIAKGCEDAKAITVDEDGSIYIAYKESIKKIDREGKEKLLYKEKDLNIEDLTYINNNLYFISDDKVESYSLVNGVIDIVISNIPSGGNEIDRRLLSKEGELFISIGAATNSGISESGRGDISPVEITLAGINFGEEKTGAFKDKGVSSEIGEKIKKAELGNGAVYKIDLEKNSVSLFVSGIRGITGLDYDNEGNIVAVFSGMKNEGLRAVNRDRDYIYKLVKGEWYGWPDFSGGDPISSPRFKGEELIKPLLQNPPKRVVAGPFYQSSSVDVLKELSIDRGGDLLQKDSLLLWDKGENAISTINKEGVYYRVLKVSNDSYIKDIVYNNEEFLILDSGIGAIYSLHEKEGLLGFKLPTIVWAFIFLLTFLLLVVAVLKFTNLKKDIK
ncbi:hypothetical protein [Clostridium sp. LP20]|uniref:hypothetical protein n=1 Tax=Clostridium sp. LP20 TaxID=3418665 RepID=UPI003EE498F4